MKIDRFAVYNKYGGLCAYTGKPLGDFNSKDWQVDHVTSKLHHSYKVFGEAGITDVKAKLKEVDQIDNLLPAIKIVNHYKRSLDLEGFRHYMAYFHKRLAKLPKKTIVAHTQRRKEYMQRIADLFEITQEKPFTGKFYFETVTESK